MSQKESIAYALRTVDSALYSAEAELANAGTYVNRSSVPLPGVPALLNAVQLLTGAVATLRDQIAELAQVTE